MPALHWPHPALWLIPLAMLAAFIPLQLYILKNNKKRGIAEPTVKIPDWLKKTTQVPISRQPATAAHSHYRQQLINHPPNLPRMINAPAIAIPTQLITHQTNTPLGCTGRYTNPSLRLHHRQRQLRRPPPTHYTQSSGSKNKQTPATALSDPTTPPGSTTTTTTAQTPDPTTAPAQTPCAADRQADQHYCSTPD